MKMWKQEMTNISAAFKHLKDRIGLYSSGCFGVRWWHYRVSKMISTKPGRSTKFLRSLNSCPCWSVYEYLSRSFFSCRHWHCERLVPYSCPRASTLFYYCSNTSGCSNSLLHHNNSLTNFHVLSTCGQSRYLAARLALDAVLCLPFLICIYHLCGLFDDVSYLYVLFLFHTCSLCFLTCSLCSLHSFE